MLRLTGDSIKALEYFVGQRWKLMLFIVVMSFVVAFFETLATVAIYPVLVLIVPQSTSGGANKYMEHVLSWLTAHSSISAVHVSVVLLFGLTLVKLILEYVNFLIIWVNGNQLYVKTQVKMMSSVLDCDYQFLLGAQKGDLAYRILTAPGYLSKVMFLIPKIVVEALKTVMIVSMLLWVSFRATLFLTVVSLIYFVITRKVAKSVSYGTGSGRAQSASNQSISVMNALKGLKFIRLFGVTHYWLDYFAKECENFYLHAKKDEFIRGIPAILLELTSVAFICVLILNFTQSDTEFLDSIPVLGLFVFSMLKMMPSLKQLGNMVMALASDIPHIEAAYLGIKELRQHVVRKVDAEKLKTFNSQVALTDITFCYANSIQPAVRDVNITIGRGQFVGIIGPSGSGKTTLLDLIAGLLIPTSGKILFDGKPISSFSAESLSEHIGYVGQDPFLTNDTIRNNVLFGRTGIDDNMINTALRKAGLRNYVESLQGGLNYTVADDGMKMSGGQRQRISIARALLKNPEILLLDEATSALDLKTEENIIATILQIVREQGKTVIFVTHRESAIHHADQVIELRDGVIADQRVLTQMNQKKPIPI